MIDIMATNTVTTIYPPIRKLINSMNELCWVLSIFAAAVLLALIFKKSFFEFLEKWIYSDEPH
jgi:hypothetical protein